MLTASNRPAQCSYTAWLHELRSHFEAREEFDLAAAIYSFEPDYQNGLTPAQSYEAFDKFVAEDAA